MRFMFAPFRPSIFSTGEPPTKLLLPAPGLHGFPLRTLPPVSPVVLPLPRCPRQGFAFVPGPCSCPSAPPTPEWLPATFAAPAPFPPTSPTTTLAPAVNPRSHFRR